MPKIFSKFEPGHPQRGRQIEVGYGKVGEFLPVNNLPAQSALLTCSAERATAINSVRQSVAIRRRRYDGRGREGHSSVSELLKC